jgi:hypothetical protein
MDPTQKWVKKIQKKKKKKKKEKKKKSGSGCVWPEKKGRRSPVPLFGTFVVVNAQNSMSAMCHLVVGRGWAELMWMGC